MEFSVKEIILVSLLSALVLFSIEIVSISILNKIVWGYWLFLPF